MKNLCGILLFLTSGLLSVAQKTNEPMSAWQQDGPLTPNFNSQTFRGWVDAVCVNANNPDEMLIATRTSGIFRTNNKGKNWTCVTDSLSENYPILGCRAMISLPSEPNHVIAVTGFKNIAGSVIHSTDFGKTWQKVEQELPTFRWIDFHPTNPDLLFACSDKEVFYSIDVGYTWQSLGAPFGMDFHANEMFKVFVKANSVSLITKARWDATAYLHELSFLSKRKKNRIRFGVWSDNLAPSFLDNTADKIIFMDFSNRAENVHYFQFETAKKQKKTLQTSDGGQTYIPISIRNFPVGHWWKNELIASPNDSNFVYWGQIGMMKRYDKRSGKSVTIINDTLSPGHHDDYRSSHVLSINGIDYLAFGHDGGVGLVENGLAIQPTIQNGNGDLSINLIHAFDVHEKTGRIVFAYQDGPMFYRDKDGTFSEHFLWEGSAAMIHRQYPDAIVGENAYVGIADKDELIHPIVQNNLGKGGCYLGGYFITYRHYPDRFARGLGNGLIAMNRGVDVSESVKLSNTNHEVGAVAICEKDPNFMYVATTFPDDGKYKLHRSTDDGKTWVNLTNSTVKIAGTVSDLNERLNWSYIKSIAVDPYDGNVVYCGMADPYIQFGEVIHERFRVIKSMDAGKTFVDYSEGLTYFPVDEILAVESDQGLLFCATVNGIYYRTKEMNRWEPFSNQLPKVEITGLKYDYCNDILYASTYGRGLWKTKVNLPIENTFQIIISEDTVWEENKILCDHLVIKAGVSLTIKARVEKYHNKEIIVEPGGKLLFDGGSISEYCLFKD